MPVTIRIVALMTILMTTPVLTTVPQSGGAEEIPKPSEAKHRKYPYPGKKILWVDSYHPGFEWSDGIEKGIRDVLRNTGVELEIFRMDTKHDDSEEFGKASGLSAKAKFEEFRPDLVIASDDNAQKYFVVPCLNGTEIPVVFCGVNWDASMYGYPNKNVTGMIEVDKIEEMTNLLKKYAKGNRIGFISGNDETERKIVDVYRKRFFGDKMKPWLVGTYDEFRNAFSQAQEETDLLIIRNYTGIKGWNPLSVKKFVRKNVKIPTCSEHSWMAPFVMVTLSKIAEEQGEYAAKTALEIMNGKKPSDIPLTENKQARLTVNPNMANAANIVFPVSLLKTANIVGSDDFEDETFGEISPGKYKGKKILWVDSYHPGYEWSDGIEKGIRDVLHDSGAELAIFRMDTKHDDSDEFGIKAGEKAKAAVEEFRPDLIIASDDNAQKYLVVPYFMDKEIPVIFCGVNWDASMYGYPAKNITGMIEVDSVDELVKHLRRFARGDRVGYLSGDVETERKIAENFDKRFFGGKMKTYLVKTFWEFRTEFLRAQTEVDMLYIMNYTGIADWSHEAAEKFLAENTRIPTGSHPVFMAPFVMVVVAKYSEEQGSHAAKTALGIFDGAKPSDIPLAFNKRSKLMINLKMARAAGIVFPVSVLKRASIIEH